MTIRSLFATALCLSLLPFGTADAQDQRLATVVVYIAGADIYLDAGSDQGLSPGDTLRVYSEPDGRLLGTFMVISSTRERAVVTFAGRPFPVTRGAYLQVATSGAAQPQRDDAAAASAIADPRRTGPGPVHRSPRLSGRLSFDLGMLESTTTVGDGLDPVERRFATPSLRLRATVNDLPAGMSFNTNLRAAARMSSTDVVQPPRSLRVYQASLGKSFEGVPLQFQLGRFYNPYETFSGYWDGLLVHVGRSGLGGGFAVGFQPERGNEKFTTDVAKYGAFLDYRYASSRFSYWADLSFNEQRPRSGSTNHRFAGLSQRLRWGRVGLSQRIRFDSRDDRPGWELTQLELRTALPLGRRLSAHIGYSFYRPLYLLSTFELEPDTIGLQAYRRERGSFGLAYDMWGGTIGADITANRLDGGSISYTYGTHFSVPRSAMLGLGYFGWASYWKRDATTTLYITPGITRTFGSLETRASYSYYSYANASAKVITHTLDLSLSLPLTRRWYVLLQGRVQRGKTLNSNSLYSGFWLSF
jgi:hypothetical protein